LKFGVIVVLDTVQAYQFQVQNPVSELTYTVLSETLNSIIPYLRYLSGSKGQFRVRVGVGVGSGSTKFLK